MHLSAAEDDVAVDVMLVDWPQKENVTFIYLFISYLFAAIKITYNTLKTIQ